jgi:hypothetical protein
MARTNLAKPPTSTAPRVPAYIAPDMPGTCDCCGHKLLGVAEVAQALGVPSSRVEGWYVSSSANLAAPVVATSVALLWCPTAIEADAAVGDRMDFDLTPTWSKQATSVARNAAGERVAWEQSTSIQVRWRVNGNSAKATFRGDGHRRRAQILIDNVAAAHRHGWPARAKFPIPPAGVTEPESDTELAGDVVQPTGAAANDVAGVDVSVSNGAGRTRTVAAAVERVRAQVLTAPDMSAKTKQDRLASLRFVETYLVYPDGHPKLSVLGLAPGDSFVLDDDHGLNADDISAFVAFRKRINLRSWHAYERHIATWEKQCATLRRKAGDVAALELPPRPEIPTTPAAPRTVRFTMQTLDQVLQLAREQRWIRYDPYTTTVRKSVGKAQHRELDVRSVFSPGQVAALVAAIASHTARVRNPDTGRYELVSGDKYALLIEIQGRLAPRPEEGIALFDSDFIDLDTSEPFLRVCGCEPELPDEPFAIDAKDRRKKLKRRPHSAYRDIPIPLDMVPRIKDHIDRFSAPNGRMFTSPYGCWLNTNNWRRHFWHPIVAMVTAPLPVPCEATDRERRLIDEENVLRERLSESQFRLLRHAGISAWLLEGVTVDEVARRAGNSIEVISKHYAGVIRDVERKQRLPPIRPLDTHTFDLTQLSVAEIVQISVTCSTELSRRAS